MFRPRNLTFTYYHDGIICSDIYFLHSWDTLLLVRKTHERRQRHYLRTQHHTPRDPSPSGRLCSRTLQIDTVGFRGTESLLLVSLLELLDECDEKNASDVFCEEGPDWDDPEWQFPAFDALDACYFVLFQSIYTALHITAWRFYFPTDTERFPWHIATFYTGSAVLLYWVIDLYVWRIHPILKEHRRRRFRSKETDVEKGKQASVKSNSRGLLARLRNNSSLHDPAMGVPLRARIPVTIVGVLYCFARAYVIIAGWTSLRYLPPSEYQTVNWPRSCLLRVFSQHAVANLIRLACNRRY